MIETDPAPFPPPLLVTFAEGEKATSYSVRHLYREADRGRLRTVGRGKTRRILYSSLLDYLALLDREGRAPSSKKAGQGRRRARIRAEKENAPGASRGGRQETGATCDIDKMG